MSLPLKYHPAMLRPYCLPLLIGATLLAPLACKSNSSDTTTDGEATTSAATTTTGTMTVPTTTVDTTSPNPTTTGEPTTAATTAEATTAELTTTGGPPPALCTSISDEILCKNTDTCKWGGVVSYTYGNQGCQGNITMFCLDEDPAGAATAWYREQDDDTQVLEFGYTPTLDAEWKPCDCDGPLACLCTSVTEACPERQEDYCGFITTELGCGNVTFMGENTCDWFKVSPEGPKDDMCAQNPAKYRCMPATDAGKDTCTKVKTPPYPLCPQDPMAPAVDPIFWREVDGVVEIIQTCGPSPVGFTQCEEVDTVEQPDECGCACT